MSSDKNNKLGSFREHKRRDSSSSEESEAFHTPPTSARASRAGFAVQDAFSSPTARMMGRAGALSLEREGGAQAAVRTGASKTVEGGGKTPDNKNGNEHAVKGVSKAKNRDGAIARAVKTASKAPTSKLEPKTPGPSLSSSASPQIPTPSAPRKDTKSSSTVPNTKRSTSTSTHVAAELRDGRAVEIHLPGMTNAPPYWTQDVAESLRARDAMVKEKLRVERDSVGPGTEDGVSVRDFARTGRKEDAGKATGGRVSGLPTDKRAREAVYHDAVHGTGKAASRAPSMTDRAVFKTKTKVDDTPDDVPSTSEDKLRESKLGLEAIVGKTPSVKVPKGSGKPGLRMEKQTPALVKDDGEMKDNKRSSYTPRSPTPTHDSITGKPLSRHRKRSPAPPVLTTATSQAEFEADLESAMSTDLDRSAVIIDDEGENKDAPRLIPLSQPKTQRARLDSETLSFSGKKDATDGPLRATSDSRIVDEDTGDWLLLETPPHDAENRHLRAPSTKDAAPAIGLSEAKNGATGLDDPRARKPISRVLKNWWTGSSRPPAEVKREPRDELLALLRERKKANVVSADKQVIEALKKHHGKAIKEVFGDDWVAHAYVEAKVRRAVEDFVIGLEEERGRAKEDKGEDESGGRN